MVHIHPSWSLPAALLGAVLATHAQSTPPAAKADPLNPQATVSPLVYQSAFAQYRRYSDERPIPWKEANDTVARIGGWRAYAREASQPAAPVPATPSAPPKPADPAKPMPPGHGEHKRN